MAKRLYTYDDIMNLPDFIRVELIDGVIHTDDWTDLEVDEEVFQNPPSEDHHVTYRLSIVSLSPSQGVPCSLYIFPYSVSLS